MIICLAVYSTWINLNHPVYLDNFLSVNLCMYMYIKCNIYFFILLSIKCISHSFFSIRHFYTSKAIINTCERIFHCTLPEAATWSLRNDAFEERNSSLSIFLFTPLHLFRFFFRHTEPRCFQVQRRKEKTRKEIKNEK